MTIRKPVSFLCKFTVKKEKKFSLRVNSWVKRKGTPNKVWKYERVKRDTKMSYGNCKNTKKVLSTNKLPRFLALRRLLELTSGERWTFRKPVLSFSFSLPTFPIIFTDTTTKYHTIIQYNLTIIYFSIKPQPPSHPPFSTTKPPPPKNEENHYPR